MRTLSAALVCFFFSACGGEYDVRVQVEPPELLDEAVAVELGIVASCEGELDEGPVVGSPVLRFAPTDSPPALGDSETGPRGLYARLVNERCEVIASGCSPVNLSAGGSDILRVIVRGASGHACATGELCREGVCAPGSGDSGADATQSDGAVDAVQTPDSGVDAPQPDASVDADLSDTPNPPDALDAGPPPVDRTCWVNEAGCDWTRDFNLESIGPPGLPAGATNAAFTPNGCGLLFSRSGDLFIVRRAPGGAFGAPEALTELNSADSEDKVIFAPGELEAFVSRSVDGDSFVFRTVRDTTSADFGDLSPVSSLNEVGFDSYDISLSGDALRFYMARPFDAFSTQDILMATRESLAQEFGEPVVVEELSDRAFDEAEPVVSFDGRVMILATTRDAESALRLYFSTRAGPLQRWRPLGTLPGDFLAEANEREGILSPDACELVVNRGGATSHLVYRGL
ncbi:MAG: hypothetical protein ACI9KE_000713 [Polyangiales bacterium]|jgi:hypothetical protein